MARAMGWMARSGAASSCWAMRPTSSGWRTCGPSACPAAMRRSRGRGGWRWPCCGSCTARPRWRWTTWRRSGRCRPVSAWCWARCCGAACSAPITTSAGRLFDGVAALLGLHQQVSFEGQAAMALEYAVDASEEGAYPLIVRSQRNSEELRGTQGTSEELGGIQRNCEELRGTPELPFPLEFPQFLPVSSPPSSWTGSR